jgi:hypothetical protein
VLQMNEISQEEQQVICAAVLRQSYQARINTAKDKIAADDENYLPYPVFILIEEAHRFAPANEPARCKQVLRTILSEGRKFGMGVGLITQGPGNCFRGLCEYPGALPGAQTANPARRRNHECARGVAGPLPAPPPAGPPDRKGSPGSGRQNSRGLWRSQY